MVKEVKMNRKTRYTRMVLQDSLMELMRENPISKISVTELCQNADINRTTFYTHYTDPMALLRSLEDETLSWARETMANLVQQNGTNPQEMHRMIAEIFEYIAKNSKHLQILLSEQGSLEFQQHLLTIIYEQCGIPSSMPDSQDLETKRYFLLFMVNGSIGVIQSWLKNGMNKSPQEMATLIFRISSQMPL